MIHIPDFFSSFFMRFLSERDIILRYIHLHVYVHFLLGSVLVFLKETGLSGCTNDLLTRRKLQMERMTEWSGPIRNRRHLERHRDSNTVEGATIISLHSFRKRGSRKVKNHVRVTPTKNVRVLIKDLFPLSKQELYTHLYTT